MVQVGSAGLACAVLLPPTQPRSVNVAVSSIHMYHSTFFVSMAQHR